MTRVRGLSNERYAERKAAITRTIRDLYDGIAAEPIPPEWMDLLDRAAR